MLKNPNIKFLVLTIIMPLFFYLITLETVRGENVEINQNNVSTGQLEVSGVIYREVFIKSVPKKFVIGKPYTFPIFVKNDGKSDARFRLYFFVPEKFFYSEYSDKYFNLDRGEVVKFDMRIVPIKPYMGELNVTAKLYAVMPDRDIEIDSVSTSIFLIERRYFLENEMLIIVIATLAIILGSFLFIFKK